MLDMFHIKSSINLAEYPCVFAKTQLSEHVGAGHTGKSTSIYNNLRISIRKWNSTKFHQCDENERLTNSTATNVCGEYCLSKLLESWVECAEMFNPASLFEKILWLDELSKDAKPLTKVHVTGIEENVYPMFYDLFAKKHSTIPVTMLVSAAKRYQKCRPLTFSKRTLLSQDFKTYLLYISALLHQITASEWRRLPLEQISFSGSLFIYFKWTRRWSGFESVEDVPVHEHSFQNSIKNHARALSIDHKVTIALLTYRGTPTNTLYERSTSDASLYVCRLRSNVAIWS